MLNNIQKQFVRLAIIHKANWMSMPSNPYRPRRRRSKKYTSIQTIVKIINAVTGEETTAKSYDDNPITLKRWLKMRNIRAQFAEMIIKPKSTWAQLSDGELKDYPIIVKLGRTKYPYLLDHMGDRSLKGKKVIVTIFLKTVDNIDYLNILYQKKKLLVLPSKIIKRKKRKV